MTNVENAIICILGNLSKDKYHELLIDMMDYYNVCSLLELNESQMLQYIHEKFNIL